MEKADPQDIKGSSGVILAPAEVCKLEVITWTAVLSSLVVLSALGIKVKDKKGKIDLSLWILRVTTVHGRRGKKNLRVLEKHWSDTSQDLGWMRKGVKPEGAYGEGKGQGL